MSQSSRVVQTWLEPINLNRWNLLRLIFASLVLVSHSWPIALGQIGEKKEPFSILSGGQAMGGAIAVNCFFIISGFLISSSWSRSKGLIDYLKRRCFRIYPGYIIAVLLSYFLFANVGGGSFQKQLAELNPSFLWFNYIEPTSFLANPLAGLTNASLWTILFEFHCYLLLAILGISGVLKNKTAVLIAFALAAGWAIFRRSMPLELPGLLSSIPLISHQEGPRLLLSFLAGATLFAWREYVPRNLYLVVICLALIVASCITGHMFTLTFSVAGTYLLAYVAYGGDRFTNFGNSVDLSYGIYLYAFPIQQIVALYMPGISPVALCLVAVIPTLLFASLSWFMVEKPFLRRRFLLKSPFRKEPEQA